MDPLRDRQSDAIWNAIEANNFKQALKLVDKKLAKKHDDYLEALRIYIRAKSPQISEKSDVLTHLEELAGRKPSVLDLAVIELYNHTVTWVLPTSSEKWAQIVGELWWQCVKASPKDENNSRNAFKACLGKDDLDHARQIANSLEKAFPANVSYAYWNITLMFMYSLSESCSESSQKLWGGLALAQITKLANATKGAANSKKPPARGIRSPQELELLHRILQENGKSDLRLEYLMDPNLGPRSAAAKGAWQMWRFELKLLEDAQKWNELFVVTLTLLKLARTRNKQGQLAEPGFGDWIVWEACIRSAIELGEATWISKIREEVEAHLDPKSGIDKSWRRNASLAWVKLHFDNDEVPAETRSTLLLKYLEESGDAITAYNDLAPYVAKLPLEQRSQVNKGLKTFPPFSTANDITRAVNKLKLAYLLTSSLPEYERQQSPLKPDDLCNECSQSCGASCSVTLKPLAAKIINGYKQALADDGSITKNLLSTDRHPADDIAVLGAMCLVKLSLNYFPQASDPLQRPAISYILQATALLESAYTHSKSNFQINLMLIRLYSYLGCGSLAMRAYQRLGVKGIQQDTLSYTILERISTLHPHPFSHSLEGMGEVKSPEEDVKHQGEYYNIAQDQCAKNIWLSFKHDSFNSILDIRGVKERLELSMGACRCVIESRKLSRLLHPEADIDAVPAIYEDLPISSTPHLSNNNDHLTFPNFEAPLGSRFEALSRFEPVPSQTRYRYALLGECILFLSSCPHPSEPELSLARQWLSAYASVAKFPSPSDEMTEAENLAAKVNHVLAMLLFQITSPPSRWAEEGYEKCLKAYNAIVIVKLGEFRELVEKKGTTAPAFQECLHILYTAHSVACTVMSFIVWMSTLQRGAFKEYFRMTTSIAESAMGLAAFVVETSTKIKKSLDEGGWIDRVLESLRMEGEGREEVSKLVEEVVGEDGVEAWAGDVLESWRESVVGLGLMKVLGSK